MTTRKDVSQGDMNVGLWGDIETAPRDGTAILALVRGDVTGDEWQDVVYFNNFVEKWFSSQTLVNPTHWMPLPQPPKQMEKSDEE